jgi:hypothetical protein
VALQLGSLQRLGFVFFFFESLPDFPDGEVELPDDAGAREPCEE